MREITLQQVLDARERRVERQRRLLVSHNKPLLVLNMNIAGPVKRGGLIDFAFFEGVRALDKALGDRVVERELTDELTGLEYVWVCDMSGEELKDIAVYEETARPIGRLYDLDVIGLDGMKYSRGTPRECIVCGGPVGVCSRSRAHGLPTIVEATNQRLLDFAAERLAEKGVRALISEVDLTPKPGLVDRRNSGAHSDMDIEMFYRSARCLRGYFERAVRLGAEKDDCMKALQQAGLDAEQTMFAVTGGVNTHKGAVYAFGLVLAALGAVMVREGDLFERAAELAKQGIPPQNTHGTEVKAKYTAGGARAEAFAGFPHAREAQKIMREDGGDGTRAFLHLMSVVEDTNLLYRGGREGLEYVRSRAREILAQGKADYLQELKKLDDECIQRNLSPGGSADIIALAYLLDSTRKIWK
ncbi:MAG: citrate lyase holo-[Clostridia bacterium]|nr:citrate lyase holo-[acyl-carrier protein] synthase [Clostridia bacterium]